MTDLIFMYDETEKTETRYVGFVGISTRFDLMIMVTQHFYGKKVVTCLQTKRSAIMDTKDATDLSFVAESFALHTEEEVQELSTFLVANL